MPTIERGFSCPVATIPCVVCHGAHPGAGAILLAIVGYHHTCRSCYVAAPPRCRRNLLACGVVIWSSSSQTPQSSRTAGHLMCRHSRQNTIVGGSSSQVPQHPPPHFHPTYRRNLGHSHWWHRRRTRRSYPKTLRHPRYQHNPERSHWQDQHDRSHNYRAEHFPRCQNNLECNRCLCRNRTRHNYRSCNRKVPSLPRFHLRNSG